MVRGTMGGKEDSGSPVFEHVGVPVSKFPAEARPLLASFDLNADGVVDLDEMRTAARMLEDARKGNLTVSMFPERLQDTVRALDDEGDGVLELDEITEMVETYAALKEQNKTGEINISTLPKEIQPSLKVFDVDGDGTVAPMELARGAELYLESKKMVKKLTRLAAVLLLLMGVMLAAITGLTFTVVELSKETSTGDNGIQKVKGTDKSVATAAPAEKVSLGQESRGAASLADDAVDAGDPFTKRRMLEHGEHGSCLSNAAMDASSGTLSFKDKNGQTLTSVAVSGQSTGMLDNGQKYDLLTLVGDSPAECALLIECQDATVASCADLQAEVETLGPPATLGPAPSQGLVGNGSDVGGHGGDEGNWTADGNARHLLMLERLEQGLGGAAGSSRRRLMELGDTASGFIARRLKSHRAESETRRLQASRRSLLAVRDGDYAGDWAYNSMEDHYCNHGGDYASHDSLDFLECRNLCHLDDGCVAFAHSESGSSGNCVVYGTCHVNPARQTWGYKFFSKAPYAARGNKYCSSYDDWEGEGSGWGTEAECRAKCDARMGCDAYAFSNSGACATYRNCVISSGTQTWGYDFFERTPYVARGNLYCASYDAYNVQWTESLEACLQSCSDNVDGWTSGGGGCNAVAYGNAGSGGPGGTGQKCVRYSGCAMSAATQNWGFNYFTLQTVGDMSADADTLSLSYSFTQEAPEGDPYTNCMSAEYVTSNDGDYGLQMAKLANNADGRGICCAMDDWRNSWPCRENYCDAGDSAKLLTRFTVKTFTDDDGEKKISINYYYKGTAAQGFFKDGPWYVNSHGTSSSDDLKPSSDFALFKITDHAHYGGDELDTWVRLEGSWPHDKTRTGTGNFCQTKLEGVQNTQWLVCNTPDDTSAKTAFCFTKWQ
eukprot:PRCOL_00005538-RA